MKRKIFSIFKMKMEYQILISIVLAFLAGVYTPQLALESAVLGKIYLTLLKFVIAPLLFFSIVTSITGFGDIKQMGRLGGYTFGIYMSTTFFAIIVSLLYMNIFSPGVGFEATYESFESTNTAQLSMSSFLLSMIPSNVISPFLTNNAMQLVFMAFIFGIASLVIVDKKKVEQVYHASNTITEIVLKFTTWIIALTPFGIFGLISSLIAKNGLSPILDLWQFVLVILAGLFTHMLITLPLLASILGKFNPYKYLIKMKEVILFAFSTASSSATLPLNLTKTVEVGKVDKKIAELVLPIGATVNMDGTALYQAGVALFVAQMVGIDLDLSQQITIAIIVVLASVGAAGIPGAGIVLLTTVFTTIGLPIEAIGVIMVVDRFLDMFRTAVNISGDIFVSKIIDRIYKRDAHIKDSFE